MNQAQTLFCAVAGLSIALAWPAENAHAAAFTFSAYGDTVDDGGFDFTLKVDTVTNKVQVFYNENDEIFGGDYNGYWNYYQFSGSGDLTSFSVDNSTAGRRTFSLATKLNLQNGQANYADGTSAPFNIPFSNLTYTELFYDTGYVYEQDASGLEFIPHVGITYTLSGDDPFAVTSVPIPATAPMFGAALVLLGGLRVVWRRRAEPRLVANR